MERLINQYRELKEYHRKGMLADEEYKEKIDRIYYKLVKKKKGI